MITTEESGTFEAFVKVLSSDNVVEIGDSLLAFPYSLSKMGI